MLKKYSETMCSSYIKEVERSGILDFSGLERPDSSDDSFSAKLASSRYLARKEFSVCHHYIVDLFEHINQIEDSMVKDTEKIQENYSTYKDTWSKLFDQFNQRLSHIFIYAQDKLIGSFEKKMRRMDNFCICLFGRTKAGKSTTMEALTSGDGASIGIGRQNTTQDVKEYHWNELLVVDTPGIDAMDNQQELENMALSFADDSDLIVFLLPHQVEEGDFEQFSRFYKQNKPILILLNIKKEIGDRDSMDFKMFLKHSDDILNEKKLSDYSKRIKDFIYTKLNIESDLIPIVPIHSSAAFVSNQEQDAEIKSKLYEISNFKELENNLIREIKEYGELYRIKNPYDTVVLFSEIARKEFSSFNIYLKEQQKVFRDNVLKFTTVKNDIENKKDQIIEDVIDSYFESKSYSVSSIVDRIFGERNEDSRKRILQDFVPESEIKLKIEQCQSQIQSEIQKEIEEFFKNFSAELRIVDIEQYKSGIQSRTSSDMNKIEEIGDTSDVLAGLGAMSSIVCGIGSAIVMAEISIAGVSIFGAAGTLFGLGSANIWNPVGWGLMGVSAVLGTWSFLKSKEKKRKLAEAKYDTRNKIRSSVENVQAEVKQKIEEWTLNIIQEIETNHIRIMGEYVEYTDKYFYDIETLAEYLENLSENAEKSKFQSMLRHLLNNDDLFVDAVNQNQQTIVINILKSGIKCGQNVSDILARVEEKPVFIFGG